jgi:GNAT superfamily N-acetyltransferase
VVDPGVVQSAAPKKAKVEVVRVGDEHAEALAAFFRRTWNPASTAADVRAGRADDARRNPVAPGEDVPAFAFIKDGEAVGYINTIPARFWNGRAEVPASWMRGFWVLPEHQNGPIGFYLLKEAMRHVHVAGALTVAPATLRLFGAHGFADLGVLPNWIGVLRPARLLSRLDVAALGLEGLPAWTRRAVTLAQRTRVAALGGAFAAGALALWRGVRGAARGAAVQVGRALPDDAEMDALWSHVRDALAGSEVRDARYMRWRYDAARDAEYRVVTVRERGALVAWAVVRRPNDAGDPRLRGVRVATLSELLFPSHRPALGLAALRGAERAAREVDADAIVATGAPPALAALLPRRAWVRIPGNVHLLVRDPAGAAGLPAALDAWWVSRGYSHKDDAF